MTTQTIPKKEHIPELQLVRALAIIGVLSVHASASATVYMKESAYFFFYNFVNIFMRFGTPTFILLSSFVLFYSYYNRPLDKGLIAGFYKKRLLYIILPYILFSFIYFVYIKVTYNMPLFSVDAIKEFIRKLLLGQVYAHLYFVFISIQFYLLFPLILWMAKRWKALTYLFIPIGFLLQWIFVYYNYYDWQLSMKGSLAPSYFSFFFAGAFFGIYYPQIKQWLAIVKENLKLSRVIVWLLIWGAWLALALAHVNIYFNARAYGTRYHGLLYEFLWNFHAFFAALVLIGLSYFIYRHMPAFMSKFLYRLGQLSFGIYLVHLLFLSVYDRLMPSFGAAWMEHLSYLGSWFVMLIGSWITVVLVSRFIPYAWVLFGKVPREGLVLQASPNGDNGSNKSKVKIFIAVTAVLLIGALLVVGIWLRSNDTVNTNKRQELLEVNYVEDTQEQYDVIVAGTDPEGIAAAISAARNDLKVLLVDGKNREILGGLMTIAGLNTLDLNYSPKKSAIPGRHNFLNKGIFQEWYDKVEGTSFDVNTAANAFYRMIEDEPNIDLLLKVQSMEPLFQPGTDGNVTVTGLRIVKGDGTVAEIAAPSVIDATQDGDLAAAAGAPFTLGREDIGDPDAQMAVTLVFALKGVTQEIWDSFARHELTGIDAMSAWGFPSAKDYESSNPERVKLRGLNIGRQNDDTMLINAMHIFKINPLDPASVEEALEIGRAEAPRMVDFLTSNFEEFKDLEFAYTFDELYVRESRHIQGEYRLTMADLMDNRDHWDAIAYGSYDVDIQATSHVDTGYILYSPMQYGVPFRSLVPLNVDGLLVVGRAASFDSLPHGSARVIPLGMATAEAAGAAAKLAADNGITFRELSRSEELIAVLRAHSTKQGMDLTMAPFERPYYRDHKAYKGLVAAVSMLLTSGNSDNLSYDLDGKSNPERIVNSLGRVSRQHPDFFKGSPRIAVEGIADPREQPLSVEQTAKTIANAIDNDGADELTLDEMIARGWITGETLSAITDPSAITNGEFFMIVRDVIQYYAGVVYE